MGILLNAVSTATDTPPFHLQTIAMDKVDVDSVMFDVPFQLMTTRSCTIHAFVGWFDCWFTPEHRNVPPLSLEIPHTQQPGEVAFTTSPGSPPTHWKQAVFLLQDPIPALSGGYEWRTL